MNKFDLIVRLMKSSRTSVVFLKDVKFPLNLNVYDLCSEELQKNRIRWLIDWLIDWFSSFIWFLVVFYDQKSFKMWMNLIWSFDQWKAAGQVLCILGRQISVEFGRVRSLLGGTAEEAPAQPSQVHRTGWKRSAARSDGQSAGQES